MHVFDRIKDKCTVIYSIISIEKNQIKYLGFRVYEIDKEKTNYSSYVATRCYYIYLELLVFLENVHRTLKTSELLFMLFT